MISLAFTGQDGSGKSTQAGLLYEKLSTAGLRVIRIHQYEPATWLGRAIAPAAKRLANTMMRAGNRGGARTSGAADRKPVFGLLGRIFASLSLAMGCCRSVANHFFQRKCDVLILDRYYPDEIVRVAHKFGVAPASGFWFLRNIIPSPTLTISFAVDSRTGWERKKTREMTFEEYREKVGWVQATLRRVKDSWKVVEINVDDLQQEEVFEIVWREVREYVAPE